MNSPGATSRGKSESYWSRNVDWNELQHIVEQGESETVEFKKSTAQLRRAMETLCAMLNGAGGKVLIGVTPEGKILGQQISDKTLRDVAEQIGRFEPPADIRQIRIDLDNGKEVLVLEAIPNPEHRPYVVDGRPYQRIGSTTSTMPQKTYQRLLAERSRARWETFPADDYTLSELDTEEILRTVRLASLRADCPSPPETTSPTSCTGWVCSKTAARTTLRSSSLAGASCRTTCSANCAWPASAA